MIEIFKTMEGKVLEQIETVEKDCWISMTNPTPQEIHQIASMCSVEEAIDDEEKSVVTLFRGMEFFLDLVKEQKISFPYTTIEEYVTQTYADGKEIFEKLTAKYEQELKEYHNKDKSFEELYGNIDFF